VGRAAARRSGSAATNCTELQHVCGSCPVHQPGLQSQAVHCQLCAARCMLHGVRCPLRVTCCITYAAHVVLNAAYVAFVSCKSRHVARWCTVHVARCKPSVARCTLHAASLRLRVTCCKPSVARCMLHVRCCMTDAARCKSSAACCRRWRSSHSVSREARKRTRRRSSPTHLGSSR
jgi:hypothetical protein